MTFQRIFFTTLLLCVVMMFFTASIVFAAEGGNGGFGTELNHRDASDTGENADEPHQSLNDASPGEAKSSESVSGNSVIAEVPLPKTKLYDVGVTLAVAVPQPLTIGIQAHRVDSPYLDAFYEAGFFKYPLTESTRSGSDYSFVAGLRYHPFHNWFYTSGELGFRHIGISVDISNLKQDGVALANTATMSLGTFFAGLLVGGEWKLTQTLSIAVDLGVQIALLHTGGIEIHADPSQDDGTDLSVDDSKEMGRISGLPLPQIAIFRFIWYI